MKKIIYLLVASLFVSCLEKESKPNETSTVKTEETSKYDLKGTWTIKKIIPGHIYAMDLKVANEFLEKQLIIDEYLHFEFKDISAYKENGTLKCSFLNIDKPDILPPNEYFGQKQPLEEFKIDKNKIKVYETNCELFLSNFVMNEEGNLITSYDGIYFIFYKNK
jgi:hypothetical protein